jgi:hypothetical protein
MTEKVRCRNCRSNKWELVGVVAEARGSGKPRTLYQCTFCKRMVMIRGDMADAITPLEVV